MASVTSLTSSSSSSTSSIYGNSNVLSGLASGMDTESMIENSIKGYKTKVTSLKKQQTSITWKQEAYRSIISKMNSMTKKYTSYTSKTNLFSKSFFDNSVKTSTTGANSAKVSATGKTSSNIQINGVKQLAKAATYSVKLGSTSMNTGVTEDAGRTVVESAAIDFDSVVKTSNVAGTLTLQYGGSSDKQFDISFDENTIYTTAEELKTAIEDKLKEIDYDSSNKLSDKIEVKIDGEGNISFKDKSGSGNSVSIQGATGKLASGTNGVEISTGDSVSSFKVSDASLMKNETSALDSISGKKIKVTFNGVTKTISMPEIDNDSETKVADFAANLQKSLDDAFGKNNVQVSATAESKLQFSVEKGSSLGVTSDSNAALGLGDNGLTSYLNTSSKLGSLLSDFGDEPKALVINGVTIGEYTSDTALETVITAINNSEAGVKVSYSKTTNEFVFSATETGEASKIDFGSELAKSLFGDPETVGTYTKGQDALFTATVNGTELDLKRSTNTADIDGLKVTLKGEFGYTKTTDEEGTVSFEKIADTEAVGFETASDTDKIVDAIKSFVEDYNALVEEIHKAYSTAPAIKTNGDKYEALSDEDKQDMSESAISAYEEKAKQGLLFGDSTLSSLYQSLRSIISTSGSDGNALKSIGITTSYASGLTTITLDESTLKDAVENNLNTVRDVFAKSKSDGASTDGVMTKLKTTLDRYASTSTASPGLLVSKAGTSLSSSSLLSNTLQKQLDSLDDQIEKWEDKMNTKIDYYTKKFTSLEKLISTMNNQSSMLAGLTG